MWNQAVVAGKNAVVSQYALCGALLHVVDFHFAGLIFSDAHRRAVESKSRIIARLIQSLVIKPRPHNAVRARDFRRYSRNQFLNQQASNRGIAVGEHADFQ